MRTAVAAVAVTVAGAAVALVVGGDPGGRPGPASPSPSPVPSPPHADGRDRLALGITEPNPAFLVPGGPPEFARWQPGLAAIRPAYYRLVVDWPAYAAPDGTAVDLARPHHGCMRDLGPCAPFGGVRAQLEALAAAQRAAPGALAGMVVVTGTPEALAAPRGGCERDDVEPRSRAPRADALPAYRALVQVLLAEVRRAGADVPYWSPWNEPNHPWFLSPQRSRCAADAPSLAAPPYARLARAMAQTLDAAPGDQRLVLGETAGLLAQRATTTDVPEFLAGLPRDVVCRADVYGQHAYVGDEDPVGPVVRGLRRFGCPRRVPVWITETGVKDPSRAGCAAVHRRLRRWYRDPRVSAAFQYTLREDDEFPTGLVRTDLTGAHPALRLWQAWGARPGPEAPPPPGRPCVARR